MSLSRPSLSIARPPNTIGLAAGLNIDNSVSETFVSSSRREKLSLRGFFGPLLGTDPMVAGLMPLIFSWGPLLLLLCDGARTLNDRRKRYVRLGIELLKIPTEISAVDQSANGRAVSAKGDR
jgi:hypothetical protein